MPLIIVESPTKSRTIKKFLGKDYEVVSSYGHIRDLPKGELGIDIEHDFTPRYVIPTKARKNVNALKKLAAQAKEIILATDEDREGEAIAYHLKTILQDKKLQQHADDNFKRIAFHEITPEAIQDALAHPRTINEALVNAQVARRVLDRLVGYTLSPLLWKKIMGGLSAGRVQSVALRLIVERELERGKFKAEEYWSIDADFLVKNALIRASLEAVDGTKLGKLEIKTGARANQIKEDLEKSAFTISNIEKKDSQKHPEPPFITSTLQQSAINRLGVSASFTMSLAQKLYETGKITYMRTDSTNLAQTAINQAQTFIQEQMGKEYSRPSQWKTKVRLAQEAHEAIRPTNFYDTPEKLASNLELRQLKLYRLIWQRALASQMTPARFKKTAITINTKGGPRYTLIAHGSLLEFDGFMRVYPLKIEDRILPEINERDPLTLKEVLPLEHFTQPPARYSEATLIKALKNFGIGRPSTYASIIEVIKKRSYVEKDENKRFFPTFVGNKVTELLVQHFPDIVDIDFTARMEEDLDKIAQDKKPWVQVIRAFYDPFAAQLQKKQEELNKRDFIHEETDHTCPKCGAPVVKKLGRYGQFHACSRYPSQCKWTQAIKQTIGMKCPECSEGDIVIKKTKKGKIFYGCSRYPDCNFASWKKPKGEKEKQP